ncbi:DUF1329 domain-containing protein [Cupriavidus pinatubonensis]|uniref:DUF1329 domain-containing protein n=1 Tax=Cupriavidus pinatubonensis TaxID=248026 RepID=UPI00112B3523|nr:DUF1329 domain-containing protein [Cupriavidus pinatubonensis]TPQ37848.1 DUF1329 domain-containing protein [Cupriavidus pinatubonensis]
MQKHKGRFGLRIISLVAALLLANGASWAANSDADLTSAGAQQSASKDGLIPAWEGKDTPSAGWTPDKPRGAFWQHKNEKPLVTIDAANVDKYADKLSPGQVAFIKATKGYRMEVYPTHRNCGAPDWVQSNSKRNLTEAKMAADGVTLENAVLPGVAFPRPKTGAEAMWNFQTRYRGMGVQFPSFYTVLSPRAGSDEWVDANQEMTMFFPWAKKGAATPEQVKNTLMAVYFQYKSPAALAGQGAVGINSFGSASPEVSYYFPGQRRVRRMPSYAYDAPQIGMENQYTVDQAFMFVGNLDRFDWKLVGKKEMYVPANSFGIYDFTAKLRDVLEPQYISNASRRYELHRVWMVEATVKAGTRHTAPKKTFYFDEDSWLALVSEDYDAQGKLWKLREGFPLPVWETGSCDLETFVQYDLISGRYVADGVTIGGSKDIRWITDSNEPRFKLDYYTPESLRARSER